jgi:hypothetical protein
VPNTGELNNTCEQAGAGVLVDPADDPGALVGVVDVDDVDEDDGRVVDVPVGCVVDVARTVVEVGGAEVVVVAGPDAPGITLPDRVTVDPGRACAGETLKIGSAATGRTLRMAESASHPTVPRIARRAVARTNTLMTEIEAGRRARLLASRTVS